MLGNIIKKKKNLKDRINVFYKFVFYLLREVVGEENSQFQDPFPKMPTNSQEMKAQSRAPPGIMEPTS